MTQVVARQERGRCQVSDVSDVAALRLTLRVAPDTFRIVQRGTVLKEVVGFHFISDMGGGVRRLPKVSAAQCNMQRGGRSKLEELCS